LVSEEPEFEAAEIGGEVGDDFVRVAEIVDPHLGTEGESVFFEEGGGVVWIGWWTAEGGGEVAVEVRV
jgi:hypothetical protein